MIISLRIYCVKAVLAAALAVSAFAVSAGLTHEYAAGNLALAQEGAKPLTLPGSHVRLS